MELELLFLPIIVVLVLSTVLIRKEIKKRKIDGKTIKEVTALIGSFLFEMLVIIYLVVYLDWWFPAIIVMFLWMFISYLIVSSQESYEKEDSKS